MNPEENTQYGDDSQVEDGERQRYEQKPYAVTCKKCGEGAAAPQQMLECYGWTLTDRGEVCKRCSKHLVRQHLQDAIDTQTLVNRLRNPPAYKPGDGKFEEGV